MICIIRPAAAVLSCLICGEPLELTQPRPSRPELMLGVCTGDECGIIWAMGDHAAGHADAPDFAPPDWRIEGRYAARPLWVA